MRHLVVFALLNITGIKVPLFTAFGWFVLSLYISFVKSSKTKHRGAHLSEWFTMGIFLITGKLNLKVNNE